MLYAVADILPPKGSKVEGDKRPDTTVDNMTTSPPEFLLLPREITMRQQHPHHHKSGHRPDKLFTSHPCLEPEYLFIVYIEESFMK